MKKRIIYFDCFSGVSGDMILGALVDAGLEVEYLKEKLSLLNCKFSLKIKEVSKHHLSGVKVDIIPEEEINLKDLRLIEEKLEGSDLEENIKRKSIKIYKRLFEAESRVHRKDPKKIHLHELSSLDTLIDIVGAVIGIDYFKVEEVFSSPLNLGQGFTSFSKGVIPAPAPATCELLKDVPVYSMERGELVTPTGASIISTLASKYTSLPEMKIKSIGYGAGERDLEKIPNFLRVFLGEISPSFQREEIVVLESNIDDSLPLIYENLMERLLEEGALDVYLIPIQMKKCRPGVMLGVIAYKDKIEELSSIIFKESTTTGIRIKEMERFKLLRKIEEFDTSLGRIKAKLINYDGSIKVSIEYTDCKKIAREKNLSLQEVYQRCLEEIKEII